MRLKTLCQWALAASVALAGTARADLVATDFWTAGDRYLVQDDSTSREWLSPVATRAHAFGDSFIQSLFAQGFRYATRAEVLDLIEDNFGLPTPVAPGDATGFAIAQEFFDVFGIADRMGCYEGNVLVKCPRTQGLTADVTAPGQHAAVGLIQFGPRGYLIDNAWRDTSSDTQLGSWLVRGGNAAQALPEPGSLALLAVAGLAAVPLSRRRKPLGNLA